MKRLMYSHSKPDVVYLNIYQRIFGVLNKSLSFVSIFPAIIDVYANKFKVTNIYLNTFSRCDKINNRAKVQNPNRYNPMAYEQC